MHKNYDEIKAGMNSTEIYFFQEHIMVTRIVKLKTLPSKSFEEDHPKYIQMNNDFYS